ncbi:N-6 DNA methylase [Nocardioides albertanoniae]|uniref:site-specific DNA-methyltransferase (adenine-specific) n=1 Tax=Nocardioides albertanoniae TaxID=1175486 RepID=A0A543A4L0_9ACTN|nr:DNA methyltransferase [Nocardioides albertanoniae]TQL67416.1 N-6 DNA methylase [Nocardioides albertanoniae]
MIIARALHSWARSAVAELGGGSSAVVAVMRRVVVAFAAARGLPITESDLDEAGLLLSRDPDRPMPDRSALDRLVSDYLDPDGIAGLGLEEIGYVYEALLEDSSRRDNGAHYTPPELADEIVAHTLAPVAAVDATVVDIAAGTGVFLLASARYLAAQCQVPVAEVITGCIYGADIDPVAVDIAKLSLWLLGADPAQPLTFLDRRILCGNSLVGLVDVDELPGGVRDREAYADAMVAVALPLGGRPGKRLEEAYAALADRRRLPVPGVRPIHWALVAPEVMARGGFDVVVGNPPYLGVKRVRDAIGQELRDYLAHTLAAGTTRRADYVIYFLLRAAALSRGEIGLITTDSISEGDTARFGLGALLERGWQVARAERSAPWPTAGVRFAKIWLTTRPLSSAWLDGRSVPAITGTLEDGFPHPEPAPLDLDVPLPHGYQGTIVLGRSLVLTSAEAESLGRGPLGHTVRPYLSGEDLVRPCGSVASRSVLDVGGLGLDELAEDPAIARRVRTRVRPERRRQFVKYPQLKDRWWGFLSPVDELYRDSDGLSHVIAFSKHSKHLWPVLVGADHVFSNGLVVYPTQDAAAYAFLASDLHRVWAVRAGGTMLNTAYRYNPSRLRATYPFPPDLGPLRPAGEALLAALARVGDEHRLGITGVLNLVGDPTAGDPATAALRTAIADVNRATACLHGIDESLAAPELTPAGFGLTPARQRTLMSVLIDQNLTLAEKSPLQVEESRTPAEESPLQVDTSPR